MDPVGIIAGIVVAGAGYIYAYRRKGKVETMTIGARAVEIRNAADPDTVFASIAAIGPPYKVDDAEPVKRMLVLSSRPSIWSYGFLYPVIVHPDEGGSRIELGVSSRFFHLGPGMGRAQSLCAKAIEALLTIPPARQLT